MTLLSVLQAFLRDPNTAVLADKASISYIPTLTTINEPTAIIKHLQAQGRQLKKNSESVLDAVEGSNALYLDTETTLEFVTSGGAYLPGLDDNFLADRIVTLPLSYLARFNGQQKIEQIRVYWDQGSLLKQLDVIGARGRNWPLRDGKDQARLIAKGAPAVIEQPAGPVHRPTSSGASRNGRSHASSTTSAASDHRSAQSLFEPPEEEEERAFTPTNGTFVAPRPSAKPPSRDLSDILAGDGDIASSDPAAQNLSPLKSGAGKHYQPMRLFDENEDADPAPLVKDIKTDPKKFKHFEFGDGEDAPTEDADAKAAAEARRKKHNSQWNFADFSTPDKVNTKLHTQNLRNFSWSDDEGDGDTSPIKRPVVHHERPDAKPHFEFRDEDTPIADRKLPILTKGRAHNDGLGLYKNHIFGEEANAEDEKAAKKPLATVTNVSNRDRRRDFDAHFDVGGASPAAKARVAEGGDKENENGATAGADAPAPAAPKLHEGQKKVLSTLQASWDMYDQPADASKEPKIYKTSGNGMGGRKDATRHWGFGNDDDWEQEGGQQQEQQRPKSQKGRALALGQQGGKSFWDF